MASLSQGPLRILQELYIKQKKKPCNLIKNVKGALSRLVNWKCFTGQS